MAADTIYTKTRKGLIEVKQRSGRLDMARRRVLILADGRRDAATIGRFSRMVEYQQFLDELVQRNYLAVVGGAPATAASAAASEPAPATASPAVAADGNGQRDSGLDEAREFMLGTLQTFTSPIHSRELGVQIAEAGSKDALKELMDPWHRLISDNPDSMQRAEEFKVVLLEKLL